MKLIFINKLLSQYKLIFCDVAIQKILQISTRLLRYARNDARVIILIIAPIVLTGCSSMNSQFDCNVPSGGKCAPMHKINKMAEHGFIDKPKIIITANRPYPPSSPMRTNETVQKIWLGPYEDASGDYHEASYLYTVTKKGQWVK